MDNVTEYRQAHVCFGRYQPITKGHASHFNSLVNVPGVSSFLYTSYSYDADRNPLPTEDKVKFLSRIVTPQGCPVRVQRDMFTAIAELAAEGFTDITYLAGGDYFEAPVEWAMLDRLKKHGELCGVGVHCTSSGTRTDGISGTTMRQAARDGNLEKFLELSPIGFGDFTHQDALDMYDCVVRHLKK